MNRMAGYKLHYAVRGKVSEVKRGCQRLSVFILNLRAESIVPKIDLVSACMEDFGCQHRQMAPKTV